MTARARIARPIVLALSAVAIVLLGTLLGAGALSAQDDLGGVRSEMDESNQRLGEMGMGLFRVTMQAPNLQSHVSLITAFIQNVQTDLDYLEALIQLFDLASDRDTAATVVLHELAGASERMQVEAFEEHVGSDESRRSEPRSMQVVEEQLLTELGAVVELYSRASDLLDPSRL